MLQNELNRDVARFTNHGQTFLQQTEVVTSCVNTVVCLDEIMRKSRHTGELRHLLQKQVCLGPVKHATCTDFDAKRSALHFLQQPDLLQAARLIRGW